MRAAAARRSPAVRDAGAATAPASRAASIARATLAAGLAVASAATLAALGGGAIVLAAGIGRSLDALGPSRPASAPRASAIASEDAPGARTLAHAAGAAARAPAPPQASVDEVRALWRRAADAGAPESALRALEAIALERPGDEAARALAHRALDDLRALRARLDGSVPPDRSDPAHDARSREARIEAARFDLRYADDPGRVSAALAVLGQSRAPDAAEAIVEGGRLVEPDQRTRRLAALWRMAADRVEPTRGAPLRDEIEALTSSSDPAEAALARRALDDLDALHVR